MTTLIRRTRTQPNKKQTKKPEEQSPEDPPRTQTPRLPPYCLHLERICVIGNPSSSEILGSRLENCTDGTQTQMQRALERLVGEGGRRVSVLLPVLFSIVVGVGVVVEDAYIPATNCITISLQACSGSCTRHYMAMVLGHGAHSTRWWWFAFSIKLSRSRGRHGMSSCLGGRQGVDGIQFCVRDA